MSRTRWALLSILAASISAAAPAPAPAADGIAGYRLVPPSEFAWKCFAPCWCPPSERRRVDGGFALTKTGSESNFDHYVVTDVRWTAPKATPPISIVGSGTYRRGGESTIQEQLVLDLSVDGRPVQRFDSGLVPAAATFPNIRTTISMRGMNCRDSVFVVVAEPIGVATFDSAGMARTRIEDPGPLRASMSAAQLPASSRTLQGGRNDGHASAAECRRPGLRRARPPSPIGTARAE